MAAEPNQTWTRPRGQAWGNEAQRAVLHAIAEDVARRSGHRVAAIEALRSDGNLEFVAIAGDPEASAKMLGRASPLSLHQLVGLGVELAGWVHLPVERLDDEARSWMNEYGHTPDRPPSPGPDGWHPEDQLARLLRNEDDEMRGILYLDEPLSGRRPTAESIEAVNAEIEVMYDAVVSIVERELYGEQVRMVTLARTAMQSVRPDLGVPDFLRELSDAMVAAMPVDSVDVLLAGEPAPELEPHTAVFEERMHQVWRERRHVVVESTQTWGVTDAVLPTPGSMRRLMDRRGLGSLLLVPIGMGEDYLGTMGLGRRRGGARWIDSEINAAAAVASDVAGLVLDARLMERERTLNAELRETIAHRRDMVMTLAHELRNPVSVLWTHLELLSLDAPPGPVADSLDAMDRATRRIEDMVEDLMTLATVLDPEHSLSQELVDLSDLVRECCQFLAPLAVVAELELRTGIADGLLVRGEAAALHRMVANLVSNAVKYTPPGGHVVLTLEAEAIDGREGVLLTCADTGLGIDAAEVAQVFTPFFRSGDPEARKRPGTGLGLAIVERVVTGHGGLIDVESELGSGTTFRIWLPVSGAPPVR